MHAKKEEHLSPEQEASPRTRFDTELYTHKTLYIEQKQRGGKKLLKQIQSLHLPVQVLSWCSW